MADESSRLRWKSQYLAIATLAKVLADEADHQTDADVLTRLHDFLHDSVMGNDWKRYDG